MKIFDQIKERKESLEKALDKVLDLIDSPDGTGVEEKNIQELICVAREIKARIDILQWVLIQNMLNS